MTVFSTLTISIISFLEFEIYNIIYFTERGILIYSLISICIYITDSWL